MTTATTKKSGMLLWLHSFVVLVIPSTLEPLKRHYPKSGGGGGGSLVRGLFRLNDEQAFKNGLS